MHIRKDGLEPFLSDSDRPMVRQPLTASATGGGNPTTMMAEMPLPTIRSMQNDYCEPQNEFRAKNSTRKRAKGPLPNHMTQLTNQPTTRVLVWFRGKDLRISDHQPLLYALQQGHPIPLFIIDPYFFAPKAAQGLPHRIQFVLESIQALQDNLRSRGSDLICIAGKSHQLLPKLVEQWNIDEVVAQAWTEPVGRKRDDRVAQALNVPFTLLGGETLHPPGTLRTGAGGSYSVYTPFSKRLRQEATILKPLPAPTSLPALDPDLVATSESIPSLETLGITRNPALLPGGERAARERLTSFLETRGSTYPDGRNALGEKTTSRLSVDLKFGTLSPRTVWHAVHQHLRPHTEALQAFSNQLIWRDFAYSTLHDRPDLLTSPFRPKWSDFPWEYDEDQWSAWCSGHTGYPVVDAAARQLLETGFVHNRARMIAASFLTKHLLHSYKLGEAHYLRYLADGDWALNNLGWQWSAGCGCDAQPYFRVFNPMSQGQKFDPSGSYVRRFVPELAKLPTKYLHEPWKASAAVLKQADVVLGETYPNPIVNHKEARQRFLTTAKAYLNSQ